MDAGATRDITGLKVKQSGVIRNIRTIRVMDDGTLRTVAVFADPLTVNANDVSGSGAGTSGATVTTSQSLAAPSGGFGPYTYAWTLFSNSGGTASTALTPSSASTAFRKTNVGAESAVTDSWQVTVTDSVGSTASTIITAAFVNISGGLS